MLIFLIIFIQINVGYEFTEYYIPYCYELSEIEIEFGEECKEADDSIEEGTRDIVLEKFLSQIWTSITNVSFNFYIWDGLQYLPRLSCWPAGNVLPHNSSLMVWSKNLKPQNFFETKVFFDQNFCLQFFLTKNCFNQKIFYQSIFVQNFCCPRHFSDQIFFWNFFFDSAFFHQNCFKSQIFWNQILLSTNFQPMYLKSPL